LDPGASRWTTNTEHSQSLRAEEDQLHSPHQHRVIFVCSVSDSDSRQVECGFSLHHIITPDSTEEVVFMCFLKHVIIILLLYWVICVAGTKLFFINSL